MRLLIKRGYSLVNDLRFDDGPIYVGRKPQCQVFLPDTSVSRQHAVIYTATNGNWMVQDLESANKTKVNGRPVTKMSLHEGDNINISDFTIEVHFETEKFISAKDDDPIDLGDTVMGQQVNVPSIYQKTFRESQNLRINARHLKHFYRLNFVMAQISDQDELVNVLTATLMEQFNAYHVWSGLRESAEGPLTCYRGIARSGSAVVLEQLAGRHLIKQAIRDETYILLPNFFDLANPGDSNRDDLQYLRSAMITPIIAPAGAYGVIYIDNGIDHEPYSHQDLDYLTLISTEMAAIIEHIG